MDLRRCTGLIAILLLTTLCPLRGGDTPKPASKPNVLFILCDDLGYGDVGAFFQNQRRAANDRSQPWHSTPNLDVMAAEGIRLTHHYCSAPVCAPSRASLLLGVHQGHANVRDNQFDKALEENHTLATVLKQAGYRTVAIGKWGLQGAPNPQPPDWPAHPLNRGFDDYFGYIRHVDGHEHYPKEGVYRGKKEVWDNRTEVSGGLDKCYTTDLFTARAKKWIIEHHAAKAGEPFFMYLAFDTPHATLELPTQPYPAGGGIKGGMQWLGTPGHMISTASGTVDSWIHPDYANATWDDDHNPATPEKPWPDVYKRYATDIRRIDDAVGDLLQLLKDLKIDDNTLVIFTSDNGPSIESYLKEHIQPTFFASYGPFDGIKRDCWEGGMRVPTIARWPGIIPAGRVSAVPCSFPDWMPTLASAAGVCAPARTDGVSLMPALTGSGAQTTPRVYIEYFEQGRTPKFPQFEPAHQNRLRRQMQALCIGDYVGVRYNILAHSDNFEIYNANTDPKEAHDLGGQADFAALQQEFKDTVLRVRRPGGDVMRPYDGELVPSVAIMATEKGLIRREFAGPFPWTPHFDAMAPVGQGISAQPDLSGRSREKDFGILYTGFVDAPADGNYTFSLTSDSGAVLRLHEATVIDADFGHTPGEEVSASILLKAGKHPLRLYYAHRSAAAPAVPSLLLQWTGPGLQKQVIPAAAFSHIADAAATAPPHTDALPAPQTAPAANPVNSPQTAVKTPRIEGNYVTVYHPAADRFSGPDGAELKAAAWYTQWVPNDHTLFKGFDGSWHAIGITHPLTTLSHIHEGEVQSFHAAAPAGLLKDVLRDGAWTDLPKVLPPSQRPGEPPENQSPSIICKDHLYYMFYGPSPIRLATSADLKTWTPQGALFKELGGARDPDILLCNGTYYMVFCTMNQVGLRTSDDLRHWSETRTILHMPKDVAPESPTLIRYNNSFYLFVCGWNDTLWDRKTVQGAYQHQTWVYQSDDPLDFEHGRVIATLDSHAPQVIQGEDGQWYLSSAEWPQHGVSIAKLDWKTSREKP